MSRIYVVVSSIARCPPLDGMLKPQSSQMSTQSSRTSSPPMRRLRRLVDQSARAHVPTILASNPGQQSWEDYCATSRNAGNSFRLEPRPTPPNHACREFMFQHAHVHTPQKRWSIRCGFHRGWRQFRFRNCASGAQATVRQGTHSSLRQPRRLVPS